MQIHELNSFVGTPSSTDYLVIDDGTETMKVPSTSVGTDTTYNAMTQAEAEAGTETEPRVISPAVLNSFVNTFGESILASIADLFVVEEFTATDVAVVGSAATPVTIPVSKTGYTPLGIVGVKKTGSGHTAAVMYHDFYDAGSGNAYVGLRNIGSNALTVTIVVKMLFVKN